MTDSRQPPRPGHDDRLLRATIRRDDSLRTAMASIESGGIGITFLLGAGEQLLGTLTDGDIRRALLDGADLTSQAARFACSAFTSVEPSTQRAEVLDLMRARRLQQVPIVDAKGKFLGVHLLHEMIGATPRGNTAVIMAGGRGERLRPLTDSVPKPMLRIAGRPILERILLHLIGFGIQQIAISVNYLGHLIEEHFQDGTQYGCRIRYLRETQPLGTAGSLSLLGDVNADPIIVLNGDLLTEFDVDSMLRFHAAGGFKISMGLHEFSHQIPYGVVEHSGDRVTGISEKPITCYLVNAGIYVVDPDRIARVPTGRPFQMTDLVADALSREERVGGYSIQESWLDVGRHEELRFARGLPPLPGHPKE